MKVANAPTPGLCRESLDRAGPLPAGGDSPDSATFQPCGQNFFRFAAEFKNLFGEMSLFV